MTTSSATAPIHTILGAGGVIGRELSRSLAEAGGVRVRQVGRTPRSVVPGDEQVPADLLDADATTRAVAGSAVTYLVAGLPYDAKVWQRDWPRVMQHAIDACARAGSALVFFDNVYAYGRVDGPMTEATPYNPCSKKGEVRAAIATTLMEAHQRGDVRAMIVRAADFYGPGALLSLTHATVTTRLAAGKTPQWVGDARAVHTFTYTPDAGLSLARLAAIPSAYGQIWHALTSQDDMTGERYVRLACEQAGRPYKLQVAPRWMLRVMGLFVPVLRENHEMMYQFEHPYRFDSRKAEAALGRGATSYADGIAACWADVKKA